MAKKLRRWLLPAAIAAVVLAAALAGVHLHLSDREGPEAVTERFLEAMEAGDFAALAQVAAPADPEVAFTAETAAPMFKLYEESSRFRAGLKWQLEEDAVRFAEGEEPRGGMVRLTAERGFLHTAHRVVIESCEGVVYTNIPCEIALDNGVTARADKETLEYLQGDGGGSAASAGDYHGSGFDLVGGSAALLEGLLPGSYEVAATVTSVHGDEFSAAGTLALMDRRDNACSLEFAYEWMRVYNGGNVDVELYVNDVFYCGLPAGDEAAVVPAVDGTRVMAQTVAAAGEILTQTATAGECGYELEVSFFLHEVLIHSYYKVPVNIYQNGVHLMEIDLDAAGALRGLPQGTELELRLGDGEATEPVWYTCEDTVISPIFYPDFSLREGAEEEIASAVEDYVREAFHCFSAENAEALSALPAAELRALLLAELEALNAKAAAKGFSWKIARTLEEHTYDMELLTAYAYAGQPVVMVMSNLRYSDDAEYVYSVDEVEIRNDTEDWLDPTFYLALLDGEWTVLPEDELLSEK